MTKAISPLRAGTIVMVLLALTACDNMNRTQQSMLSGGAMGAAGGAVVTAVTGGCVACGAVIGGAVGTAGGYVVHQMNNGNN